MTRPNGGRHRRTRLVQVRTRTDWPAMTTITARQAATVRALVLLALLIAGVLLLAGCQPADNASGGAQKATTSSDDGAIRKCALGQPVDKCPVVTETTTTTTAAPVAKPAAPKVKPPTVAQQQALIAAQSYIDEQSFSKKGLLEQLTSKAGEGFSKADAAWAVARVHVDWNAEAVEAAKSYLEMGGFSRASLIEQLTSSAGEQFTRAQALYAVKKVGL